MPHQLDRAWPRVDEYIRQRMLQAGTPGLAVAITDGDRSMRLATYGVADLGTEVPVTADTLFGLGSIGKTFTAIAALQAVEQGLLNLDTPVTAYLPWLVVQSSYPPITLHHLLSHSAGIVRGTELSPDPRSMAWALRELPATFAPGTRFHYSDLGYKIVGLVLERVCSRPYADIIQAGILDPLAMLATSRS